MARYEVKPNERSDNETFPWRVVDTERRMTIGIVSNAFTAHLLANRLNLVNMATPPSAELITTPRQMT